MCAGVFAGVGMKDTHQTGHNALVNKPDKSFNTKMPKGCPNCGGVHAVVKKDIAYCVKCGYVYIWSDEDTTKKGEDICQEKCTEKC